MTDDKINLADMKAIEEAQRAKKLNDEALEQMSRIPATAQVAAFAQQTSPMADVMVQNDQATTQLASVCDLVNGLNPRITSRLIRNSWQQQEYDDYWNSIDKYEETSFTLTNNQIDSLIMAVHEGKNTYADFQELVPPLNSATLISYLCNKPKYLSEEPMARSLRVISVKKYKESYFQFAEEPEDFIAPYEFKPEDIFDVSVPGDNRLTQLLQQQKSGEYAQKSIDIAEASLKESKIATKNSKIAIYIAILSVLITIVQFFLPLILSELL